MNTRALSLLEVMIALAILTVSILSIVPLFAHGISYAKRARALTEATHLLRSEMEEVLSAPMTRERIQELEEVQESTDRRISVEIRGFSSDPSLKVVVVRAGRNDPLSEGLFLTTIKRVEGL